MRFRLRLLESAQHVERQFHAARILAGNAENLREFTRAKSFTAAGFLNEKATKPQPAASGVETADDVAHGLDPSQQVLAGEVIHLPNGIGSTRENVYNY